MFYPRFIIHLAEVVCVYRKQQSGQDKLEGRHSLHLLCTVIVVCVPPGSFYPGMVTQNQSPSQPAPPLPLAELNGTHLKIHECVHLYDYISTVGLSLEINHSLFSSIALIMPCRSPGLPTLESNLGSWRPAWSVPRPSLHRLHQVWGGLGVHIINHHLYIMASLCMQNMQKSKYQ